jgi:hypothetical protein
MAGALMAAHAAVPGVDCHQAIRDAAAGLLTRAQADGTARPGLTAPDLIQLVVGIALATAHTDDADQPERLLAFVLESIFTGRSRRRA